MPSSEPGGGAANRDGILTSKVIAYGLRGSPWLALTYTESVLEAFVIPASDGPENIF